MIKPLSTLSGMVALISHDLRHPLTAILANAEFLTRSDVSERERNEVYEEIRSAIERMNELVASLLECSTGRDALRRGAQSIVDTVDRVMRMTSVRQDFQRITITHHHEGVEVGWFDANRLERVVVNLMMNACEAVSPDSGRVVIRTIGSRERLQIEVWDNGPGVSSMIRDSAFEPFVSFGKAEGSGLGLAIAKKLIEDHGGEIQLDETVGTGALFRIVIPFGIPEGPVRGIGSMAFESNGLIVDRC